MISKEIIDKTESVEIPENKFAEITADRTSIEETKTFWNRVFYGESDEVSEESLWDEIMYCDELDFDFSDVVTDDTKEVLELFNSDNWENLDVDERYELITELVDSIGQGLGLENIPEIELVDREDNCSGYYSERGNYIGINVNYWDDYEDIVDTVAHETRHAYQRFRADKRENHQNEVYKFNFDHYISTDYDTEGNCIHFKEYYEQYIEAEARAYAKEFTAEVAR
ncbi:hypothetical protein ACTQ1U_05465 [Thermoguttaceae bacterium LCP21S3_D4]